MAEETAVIQVPQELAQLADAQVGLSKDKADEHLRAFAPYMEQLATYSQEMEGINYDNPTDEDAKKAREIRLKLVPVRTGAEKEKDSRKKSILTEGNLIQAAYNLIANTSKMKEENLAKVEKFREELEKQRIAELTQKRMNELEPFGEAIPDGIGMWSEDVYQNFLIGSKKRFEDRQEAERLRLEAEEKARLVRELNDQRSKDIRVLSSYLTEEEAETNLGEMTEEAYNQLVNVLSERKAEADKERERVEKELEAERQRAAEEKAKADAEAAKQKAELDRIRKEKEEAEAELKRKEAEDARLKAEAEAKAKQDEKERKAAERKAKNAPDADKLKAMVSEMKTVTLPHLKTDEARELAMEFLDEWQLFLEKWASRFNQL